MNDPTLGTPHFLRVVRAIAKVSGVAAPIAVMAALTPNCGSSTGGPVGSVTMNTGGAPGVGGNFSGGGMGAFGGGPGNGGGPMGVVAATGGAGGAGTTSGGGQAGGPVGVVPATGGATGAGGS